MMNDHEGVLVLIPQFVDRSGREVYNIHRWTCNLKTPKTVQESPVLGQIRMVPGDGSVEPEADWGNSDLFGD